MNAEELKIATDALQERLPFTPEAMLVLGSGLGALADAVEDPVAIPFAEVPGFPLAGVVGHAGRYVAGVLEGRKVLVQAGRFHVYEGHAAGLVIAPIRIGAGLGIETLLVTNAAGGVNRRFVPGDIMLIDDHLNMMGRNPLMGDRLPGEDRFPDMSVAYDAELRALAESVALERGVPLRRGVYAAVTGPSYETPAEVRMLSLLGADAVGMSTVPEVIAARARGMRVLGFSLITNHAAGLSLTPLSHDEVLETGRVAAEAFGGLVRGVVRRLSEGGSRTDG